MTEGRRIEGRRTEKLRVSTVLLDNLHQPRLQLLNGRNVIRQNTHLSGLGGNVDLDTICYHWLVCRWYFPQNARWAAINVHILRLEDRLWAQKKLALT